MRSEDELDEIQDKVSTSHKETKKIWSLADGVVPIGLVISIIVFLAPGIWFASSTNSQFQDLGKRVTKLETVLEEKDKVISEQEKRNSTEKDLLRRQVYWLRSVTGNVDNRWTFSMQRDFVDKHTGLNALKSPDLDYIYKLHSQSVMPFGDFPTQ